MWLKDERKSWNVSHIYTDPVWLSRGLYCASFAAFPTLTMSRYGWEEKAEGRRQKASLLLSTGTLGTRLTLTVRLVHKIEIFSVRVRVRIWALALFCFALVLPLKPRANLAANEICELVIAMHYFNFVVVGYIFILATRLAALDVPGRRIFTIVVPVLASELAAMAIEPHYELWVTEPTGAFYLTSTSHTRTVSSKLAVSTRSPSGLNCADLT